MGGPLLRRLVAPGRVGGATQAYLRTDITLHAKEKRLP